MSIYFIQAGDDGPVKIGFATDVRARIKVIQTNSPEKLSLIRQIDGDVPVERWFHKQFNDRRLNGEWFSFCDEMLTILPPVIRKREKKPREQHLCDAIRAALLKRAPDHGQTQWLKGIAADIQVHPNTMHRAFRAQGLINAAIIWCLCEKFPGFRQEIYGNPCAPGDSMEVAAEIAQSLRAYADRLEASQAPVVPLKGSGR